ncbi:MAG: methyltransferase domain-containing protein [Solirubrobacterales bacterium]
MAEMWDSVASGWERNAQFVDAHIAPATELLLDEATIGPGDRVLDLATGPGGAGVAAAERVGDGGRVVLADVAGEMVAAAGRRTADDPRITTLVCDQMAIDAPDESFDAVIVRHGLMFAEDPVAAVREAARVLRSGRRYAAMTWDRRDANPWLGVTLDAVSEHIGAPVPPPGIRGPFSLDEPDLLVAAFGDAGLEDVRARTVATPMTAASLEDWWDRVLALAGPLAVVLANMEPEARAAVRERALRLGEAAARRTGDGITLAGSVIVASGRRA